MSSKLVGEVILDQFRVDAFLDAGGMGSVYKVWDIQRNVPLAMKVLHADLAEDPTMFKRFKREALALQKLAHPNIVPFYGLYQTENFTFILERFIDGPTLKEILKQKRGNGCSVQEALVYLKAVSSALGYAHANGVVHCDIKPGNVMIDRGGSVYLADFGIARHSGSTITTMAGAGTPAYMAPEQIRAEAVSPATDIYTLGLLAFELLTGRRPFSTGEEIPIRGKTQAERLRYSHSRIQPPDPRQFRSGLPQALSAVLLRSMANDPLERFSSALDFFTAFCQAVQENPNDVPDRFQQTADDLGPLPETSLQPREQDVGVGSGKGRSPIRGFWWVVPFVIIVLVGLVVFLPGPQLNPDPTAVPATQVPAAEKPEAPTPVPTWTPTPLQPTLKPTDTPLVPVVLSFYSCLNECNKSGSNRIREFPEATERIYLYWTYQNIPIGSEYIREWSMDGQTWVRYECTWPGPSNGTAQISLRESRGLRSGTWQVTISVDGKILLREQLMVKGNYTYWSPAGTFFKCYDD